MTLLILLWSYEYIHLQLPCCDDSGRPTQTPWNQRLPWTDLLTNHQLAYNHYLTGLINEVPAASLTNLRRANPPITDQRKERDKYTVGSPAHAWRLKRWLSVQSLPAGFKCSFFLYSFFFSYFLLHNRRLLRGSTPSDRYNPGTINENLFNRTWF